MPKEVSLASVVFLSFVAAAGNLACKAPEIALAEATGGTRGGGGGKSGNGQRDSGFTLPDAPPVREMPEPDGPPANTTCGNATIEQGELCDDGNRTDGDGCSGDCETEADFVCDMPGKPCVSTVHCGDGVVAGHESCDDGNTSDGDGCSATCVLEPAPANDISGNAWRCPSPGKPCERTTCGNSIVEGSEQCDDGNNNTGDGCSPLCRKEPVCDPAGGPCMTACGDGLLLPIDLTAGQECDDGNTVSGDGCSDTCKVEPGYKCTSVPTTQTTLLLPIIIRDMKPKGDVNGHPDFEAYFGNGEAGITLDTLGADAKPHHVPGLKMLTVNNHPGFTDKDYFAIWWNDDPAYNKTIRQFLTLTSPKPGVFTYFNAEFLPIDNMGWGNSPQPNITHNFNFTDEVRSWFEYQGNELLNFTGDDDLWVFINKKLALDLGGVHSEINGLVQLAATDGTAAVCDLLTGDRATCRTRRKVDLGLKIGSVYEIAVFHAERRTIASNYKLTLTGFGGSHSNCVSARFCGDGVKSKSEQCDLGAANEDNPYGKDKCSKTCAIAPYCGDGRIQRAFGEECDGNVRCTPACKLQPID